jgi:hypothetical protein
MTSNNQFKNFVYKAQSTSFSKCFFPVEPQCSKRAIQAHSIQNRGVLGELAENNHVVALNPIQDLENGPRLEFQRVGRNKATTFMSLCNEHDTLLFLPIDSQPFNISCEEHLFLLSYRSVLRELHAQCRAAIMVQNLNTKGVDLGHFDEKEADYPMMSATVGLIETWGFYNYSCFWANAYLTQNLDRIHHRIITIPNTKAKFAVSSVYSLVDNIKIYENRQIPKCIAFNVFPYEDGMVAIWSYPAPQCDHFASHLHELSQTEGEYRKYMLSKLILRYCENFVLAPSFYESLSEQRIESIKNYYFANVSVGVVDYEDKNLFLF